ncbi:MAG: type II secretion system F family protein [Candidatus Hydrogenedentes bacterium]|nr:type II secretion system F family protein [Candidatus Hydrogenedentota bacterium]
MPQFRYEVKKGPEEKIDGVLEAESQRAAVARLRDMGYFPLTVEEVEEEQSTPRALVKRVLQRIRLKDRNIFFRQLANLTEAGMMLTRALRTIATQAENPQLAAVVDQIRESVQQGSTLADALAQHEKLFPPLYINLVRAGETGGMLDEVLWRIVAFGEQEEELRGKAISALIYPIFLSIVSSISVFILVSFVFPKFIGIFKEFNAELPLPTVIVMAICEFMGNWWWAVLLGVGVAVWAAIRYFRSESGRRQWDTFILRVPVVRGLVQKYEMAKFARTLGTLLDNGVPILTTLQITADTMSNYVIREEVRQLHGGVTAGNAMSETLRQCPHFPPVVVGMFAVGEESGRIGAVTNRIADAYDLEVERAVKAVTALFEPLLIVIMGVIIGFLVIAMLLPMLTLSSAISA